MALSATLLASCQRKGTAEKALPATTSSASVAAIPTQQPVPLDSAAPTAPVAEVIARGLDRPGDLVIGKDRIYVVAMGAADSIKKGTGAVLSIPKRGGPPSILASAQLFPHGIVLGPDEHALYWSSINSAFKMPVSGGAPSTIYHRDRTGIEVAGVDDRGVYVNWSQGLEDGGLLLLPNGGLPPVTIFSGAVSIYTHLSENHIALCNAVVVGSVWVEPPYTDDLLSKFSHGACDGITSEGSLVYWSQGGTVYNSAVHDHTLVRAYAKYLALKGDYLYWFDEHSKDSWRIARTPKVLGIEVNELVTGLSNITAAALDDEYVYWTDSEAGTLSRVRVAAERSAAQATEGSRPPALTPSAEASSAVGRPPASNTETTGATATKTALGSAPPGMVAVPAGEFTMGDDTNARARPSRRVKITKPFFIDITEVTVADYAKCVASALCTATTMHGPVATESEVERLGSMCNAKDSERGNHPINCVDRRQASAYCSFVGGRLPTEAEWEYSARGPDGRAYPWGSEEPKCDKAVVSGCVRILPDRASTKPVASYPAVKSPFGALDMAGNVWEWVADGWSSYDPSQVTDPAVSGAGNLGVIRGGSWDFGPAQLKASARWQFYVTNGYVNTGFRCAKDAAL